MSAPSQPPAPSHQLHAVWFVSGYAQDELDEFSEPVALYQDLMVLRAENEYHAEELARELLEARCEFPSTVMRVVSRAELQRVLGLLDRVESGELAVASLADESHYEWEERYLTLTDTPAS